MAEKNTFLELFRVFLKLGLTSFGGPVAHIGYFREEFVARRRWVTEKVYGEFVALCHFLPGPASSQVGFSIGFLRGGVSGGLAAWLGFTLPSAIAMVVFAAGIVGAGETGGAGWLRGLNVVAVAVVARAVWGMAKGLCRGITQAALSVAAAAGLQFWHAPWAQVVFILCGAAMGTAVLSAAPEGGEADALKTAVSRRGGAVCLALFFAILVGLPVAVAWADDATLAIFEAFYRAGAFVFGGGHVVLPLLESAVVTPGWVSEERFLAGYGAAQAVPGPLFTFAAFLGTASGGESPDFLRGFLALAGIFLPSFLLVVGVLPYWEILRKQPRARGFLAGANATVVGVLAAALYDPVWTGAISSPLHAGLAAVDLFLLAYCKVPPWGVVVISAVLGGVFL